MNMMSNNSSNVNAGGTATVGTGKGNDNPAEQGDATMAVDTTGFNHHSNSLDKRQNRNDSSIKNKRTLYTLRKDNPCR